MSEFNIFSAFTPNFVVLYVQKLSVKTESKLIESFLGFLVWRIEEASENN